MAAPLLLLEVFLSTHARTQHGSGRAEEGEGGGGVAELAAAMCAWQVSFFFFSLLSSIELSDTTIHEP